MVVERDRVMEELHDFYTKYEGKSWKVTDEKYKIQIQGLPQGDGQKNDEKQDGYCTIY